MSITNKVRWPFGLVLTVGVLVFFPATLAAQQDCGVRCVSCGADRWEGIQFSPSGEWDMQCTPTGEPPPEDCFHCEGPHELDATFLDASELAGLINNVTIEEFPALVEGFGSRLLLNPERQLLVVKGTTCGPEVIGSLVFLTPERANALGELEVELLSATVTDSR